MSAPRPSSGTVTVKLPEEVESRLSELAGRTRRSKAYLAREAITAYVERELEIASGVMHGLDDMEAGRVVSHEDAMQSLRRTADAWPER